MIMRGARYLMHEQKCMAFVEDDASAAPHKLSLAAEQDLFAALSAALLENPERPKSYNTDTEPASSWSEANIWTIRPGEVGAKGRQNSAALKKLDDNLGRRGLIILGALVLTLGVGFSGGWASHKYVGVEAHTTGQKQTVLPSVHPEVAVTAVPKTDMLSRAPALRQTSPSLGPATN